MARMPELQEQIPARPWMARMPELQEQIPARTWMARMPGPPALPAPGDTSHIHVGRIAGANSGKDMDGPNAGSSGAPGAGSLFPFTLSAGRRPESKGRHRGERGGTGASTPRLAPLRSARTEW